MLMYEIWTLGKKPFPDLSPIEVKMYTDLSSVIRCVQDSIPSLNLKYGICNFCLGTGQLIHVTELHRAMIHEAKEYSQLASVLLIISISHCKQGTLCCPQRRAT